MSILKFLISVPKAFICKRTKLATVLSVAIIVVSGIASRYTQTPIFLGVVFLSSIFSFLRIVTYRIGKFPFIMSDNIWDVIRLKHKNSEEAEERYKNYSLKSASIWFSIMSLTFVIWMIIEIIYLIQ